MTPFSQLRGQHSAQPSRSVGEILERLHTDIKDLERHSLVLMLEVREEDSRAGENALPRFTEKRTRYMLISGLLSSLNAAVRQFGNDSNWLKLKW